MDKMYKLLRNNRQTGPFTLEELVQGGLKPYDLIWAEGLTAGWMYPSELEALKPYLAEEKNVPQQAAPVVTAPTGTHMPLPETTTAPAATGIVTVPSSARHIFISLPARTTGVNTVPVQTAAVPAAAAPQGAAEEETPEQKLERKAIELRQRVQAAAEAKKAETEEPSLDTKYARSLDDIKEEYSHWMQEQRRKGQDNHKRSDRLTLSGKQWMRVALVLVMAGAGYGVVRWLTAPGTPDTTLSNRQPITTAPASTFAAATGEHEPVQSVVNTDYSERNDDLLTDLERANRQIEEDLERIRSKEKPAPAHPKKEPPYDIPVTYGAYEEAPANAQESETSQPPPPSAPVRTTPVRNERKAVPLNQLIDVKVKYLWTGRNKSLSGLDLALRNNSTQVLKTVAIDVFYYKDDRLLEKKTVYFNDVQPGQNFTLTAPGNKRASSATYQLGLISSEGGLYVAR